MIGLHFFFKKKNNDLNDDEDICSLALQRLKTRVMACEGFFWLHVQ